MNECDGLRGDVVMRVVKAREDWLRWVRGSCLGMEVSEMEVG